MTKEFQTPTDWKSAAWWRNRSPEERVFHAKVPPRFYSVEDITVTSSVSKWLANYKPGDSLIFHGKSGTGKTTVAQAILRELISSHKLSGRFVTSDRYLEMLKDQFDSENVLPSMYSSPYLVKYIQGVFDILLLDGVGQERETDFSIHEIGSLIRRRYEDMRTTIITTTLGTTDFTRRYGERVKSAVIDMHEEKVS
jgi:DNA replication protein DnaC